MHPVRLNNIKNTTFATLPSEICFVSGGNIIINGRAQFNNTLLQFECMYIHKVMLNLTSIFTVKQNKIITELSLM